MPMTKIREVRLARGFTQQQVADLLDTSSGVISRWETQPSRVNVPTLENLARVLDCTPSDLLLGVIRANSGTTQTVETVMIQHHDSDRPAPFDRRYLAELTPSAPDVLVIVTVEGDAMQPTLADGDCVMVDTSTQKIDADGLYCIRIDDSAVIRRISVHPVTKKIDVRSDNSAYMPIFAIEKSDLDVIGHVIWRCGKL